MLDEKACLNIIFREHRLKGWNHWEPRERVNKYVRPSDSGCFFKVKKYASSFSGVGYKHLFLKARICMACLFYKRKIVSTF